MQTAHVILGSCVSPLQPLTFDLAGGRPNGQHGYERLFCSPYGQSTVHYVQHAGCCHHGQHGGPQQHNGCGWGNAKPCGVHGGPNASQRQLSWKLPGTHEPWWHDDQSGGICTILSVLYGEKSSHAEFTTCVHTLTYITMHLVHDRLMDHFQI